MPVSPKGRSQSLIRTQTEPFFDIKALPADRGWHNPLEAMERKADPFVTAIAAATKIFGERAYSKVAIYQVLPACNQSLATVRAQYKTRNLMAVACLNAELQDLRGCLAGIDTQHEPPYVQILAAIDGICALTVHRQRPLLAWKFTHEPVKADVLDTAQNTLSELSNWFEVRFRAANLSLDRGHGDTRQVLVRTFLMVLLGGHLSASEIKPHLCTLLETWGIGRDELAKRREMTLA